MTIATIKVTSAATPTIDHEDEFERRPANVVAESQQPDHEHPDPVAVASFGTTGEAEVAQAKLMSFGIESELSDRVAGGTVPVDGEPGVSVVVRAVDEVQARRVLTPEV
ncbi:hypothetical protein BH23ACT3_BH23ACT3_10520 [soil metagenome]